MKTLFFILLAISYQARANEFRVDKQVFCYSSPVSNEPSLAIRFFTDMMTGQTEALKLRVRLGNKTHEVTSDIAMVFGWENGSSDESPGISWQDASGQLNQIWGKLRTFQEMNWFTLDYLPAGKSIRELLYCEKDPVDNKLPDFQPQPKASHVIRICSNPQFEITIEYGYAMNYLGCGNESFGNSTGYAVRSVEWHDKLANTTQHLNQRQACHYSSHHNMADRDEFNLSENNSFYFFPVEEVFSPSQLNDAILINKEDFTPGVNPKDQQKKFDLKCNLSNGGQR